MLNVFLIFRLRPRQMVCLLLVLGLGCGRDFSVIDRPTPPVRTPVAPTADGTLGAMTAGRVKVFAFVRVDCPIANRYAPEMRRIYESSSGELDWWTVYPNPNLSPEKMANHVVEFELPGKVFHDKDQLLVRQTGASITPEVAVYGIDNQLVYCGRIDDRYVDFGKARPAPTQRDLENAIQAALAGKTVSPIRQPAVGCYIRDLQ